MPEKYRDLSTSRRTVKLSAASVEMTFFRKVEMTFLRKVRDDVSQEGPR
jgi:hypothetical protein